VSEPVLDYHGQFAVVRDDLVPGGTKAAVLPHVLEAIGAADEVTYASPAYGYAQLALAHACAATGRKARIFVARRKKMHLLTAQAQAVGARIVQVDNGYLNVVQARQRAYCHGTGATLVPFGLDMPEMVEAIAERAARLPLAPGVVWCVAGSGVLTRALQYAWPRAVHYAVQIGRPPKVGNAYLYQAPESFEQDAKQMPPWPSCSNYDAKLWQFARRSTHPALIWNVAA
jgi:hypothetical protein